MRLNVVIVDDEAEINQGLSRYIAETSDDFDVIATFTRGRDALEFIRANQVNILITDINMPDINGLDIIKALHGENKGIDIMIISGYRDFEYATEALKYNVHRYLLKPIDFKELSGALFDIRSKYAAKSIESHDSDAYIINKTLVDIRNNMITTDRARGLLGQTALDVDKYNYTLVSILFSNLTDFLETKWNYGKGQFYDAVSNILNDAGTLSENPLNKFYFLAPGDESLEFVYVGNTIEQNVADKLASLIEENFDLTTEFVINSTAKGLDAFSDQFNKKDFVSDTPSSTDFVIQKATAFIEQNFTHDISLYDVASHVNLNYVYFSKFFKQCTGVKFIDYIIDLRLKKAIELLKTRKYTISEISTMIGYQSHTYFLRLFKSHMGCSPKEFVRRYLTDETI